jgi:hypothetical protein
MFSSPTERCKRLGMAKGLEQYLQEVERCTWLAGIFLKRICYLWLTKPQHHENWTKKEWFLAEKEQKVHTTLDTTKWRRLESQLPETILTIFRLIRWVIHYLSRNEILQTSRYDIDNITSNNYSNMVSRSLTVYRIQSSIRSQLLNLG